jgi:hypothetical protein
MITKAMWDELHKSIEDLKQGQRDLMTALVGNDLGSAGVVPTQIDHSKRLQAIELKVFTVAATVSLLLSIAWYVIQQYLKK